MVQTSNVVTTQMSAAWKSFLEYKVNSFIKWDLVRFFHDNPHTADSADNIAHVVGRDTYTIRRELDGLVAVGVLVKRTISGQNIYHLTENKEDRQLIHEFVVACHSREFRVKAIDTVIRAMGFTPQHDL